MHKTITFTRTYHIRTEGDAVMAEVIDFLRQNIDYSHEEVVHSWHCDETMHDLGLCDGEEGNARWLDIRGDVRIDLIDSQES